MPSQGSRFLSCSSIHRVQIGVVLLHYVVVLHNSANRCSTIILSSERAWGLGSDTVLTCFFMKTIEGLRIVSVFIKH